MTSFACASGGVKVETEKQQMLHFGLFKNFLGEFTDKAERDNTNINDLINSFILLLIRYKCRFLKH